MKLIELCRYTSRQSLCDEGYIPKEPSAEEIMKELEN